MTVMDFPSSPINGQTTTDGRYYFDSSVGTAGAWRSTPLPVGGLPAGSIIQWSSNTAPANWLICDGAAVSRTVYSSLFAVVGTTYGAGDGSTTFNLPDLRGRVPVGRNGGTFGTLAGTGGAETHTHGLSSGFAAIYRIGSSFLRLKQKSTSSWTHTEFVPTSIGASESGSNTSGVDLGGSTDSSSNLQPYLVVNYIIKTSAGWTAGDSELATRVGALELADATTNKSGLVPIIPTSVTVGSGTGTVSSTGMITFSGASSIRLNGIFTSTYSNYVIKFYGNASGVEQLQFRMSTSGTEDSTASRYLWTVVACGPGDVNTQKQLGSTGASYGAIGYLGDSANSSSREIQLYSPAKASPTAIYAAGGYTYSDTYSVFTSSSNTIKGSAQYDGIWLAMGAGNHSGTYQVFGIRN